MCVCVGGWGARVQASRRQMFPVAIERLCSKLILKWLPVSICIREVHAFNCLGYIKKYADSGTRTSVVCF